MRFDRRTRSCWSSSASRDHSGSSITLDHAWVTGQHAAEQRPIRAQPGGCDSGIAPVVLGPGDADAIAQPIELLGIDRVYGEAAVQKSIHHRSMRHLNRHRDRAWVARSRHEPIAQGRQARPAVGERPLAHNFARPVEQADLVLCRAPVDASEPAECLISHGPVLSCSTSRHDACRNLYWRSRARLPTGHPSWPACRGTDPRLVLVARVHGWSLPAGRLARSAYTRLDRALPGYRCTDHGCGRTDPYPVRIRRGGRTPGVPGPACD